MNFFKKNNSTDPYSFAVIGLTNSGKSTFLARLYGSSVINPSETGRDSRTKRSYLISFGLATETDERKSASLSAIKELWKNITTHSDREFRSKTSDKSFLTFKVEGGSIEGQRVVETADVPGETFRTEKDNREDEKSVSAGVKDEDIRRFKDEFNRHCPKCNAALIIVAAETFDDPDANQLVKSAISTVGARNVNGCPIFKVIAVSKAASRIKEESRKAFNHNLRKFEKELCAATKTKGLIRCVACDALEDLVKDGDGWRLPKEGDPEKTLPRGVLTPSDVMKLFFDMEAAYYAKRRFKVAALAVLSTSLLLGAWCWQGLTADRHLFDDTMGQTADVRRKGLESYLKAPFLGRLYFPGRYFKSKACAEWRKVVFDRPDGTFYRMPDGNAANLDQKLAELDRIERGFCTVAGTQEIAALRDELNKAVMAEQGKWRVALSNAVEELHSKCASQGDLKIVLDSPDMPSLTNEVKEVCRFELGRYQSEERLLREEEEMLRDTSDGVAYCDFLNDLATRPACVFASFQKKRVLYFKNARDSLARDVKDRPFFVGLAAGKFQEVETHFNIDSGRKSGEGESFSDLKKQAEERKEELNRLEERLRGRYADATSNDARLKVCGEAMQCLKDHPSVDRKTKDGWKQLQGTLKEQSERSQRLLRVLREKLSEQTEVPQAQIALVKEALATGDFEVAEEVKAEMESLLRKIEGENVAASNKWKKVIVAQNRFRQEGGEYAAFSEALDEYLRMVQHEQERANGIKIYDHTALQKELADAKSRADKLLAEYWNEWRNRHSSNDKVVCDAYRKSADRISALLHTLHRSDAEKYRNEWVEEIRSASACETTSDDSDFARAMMLIRVLCDYEERLGIKERDGNDRRVELQDKWNEKHFQMTSELAKRLPTKEALDKWIEYFKHDDTSWIAYRDDEDKAQKEMKRLIGVFVCELKGSVDVVRKENVDRDVTTSVFSEQMEKLSGYERAYLERALPDNVDFKNALSDVRKLLRDRHLEWHKKLLDDILKEIPAEPSGRRVLTKWSQLEEIDRRLSAMSNEPSIVSMLPKGFYEKWKQKKRQLEESKFDLGLRVKSFGFKLTEKGDGPTKFMPGFDLGCRYGGKKQPVLHYEERTNPKKDPARLNRSPVTLGNDKHQYILFTGKPDEDFKEAVKGVKAGKDLGLDFVFKFVKSADRGKEISLTLLTRGETPASLMKGEKDKFANEVYSLKYKDWRRHEYDLSEFKLEVELLDPSCLNDFLIPSTAEAFFKSIEK